MERSGQTGMKNHGNRVAVLHLLVFFFFRDRVSLLFHFGRLWEDPPVLTRWGDVRIMPVDQLSAVLTRTFRSVFPNGVACCAHTLLYPWLGFSKSSLPPLPSPPPPRTPFPPPGRKLEDAGGEASTDNAGERKRNPVFSGLRSGISREKLLQRKHSAANSNFFQACVVHNGIGSGSAIEAAKPRDCGPVLPDRGDHDLYRFVHGR